MFDERFTRYRVKFFCAHRTGVVVLAIWLAGCAATRPPDIAPIPAPPPAAEEQRAEEILDAPSEVAAGAGVEMNLQSEFERWHATPHRWGGTTPHGADCSGFVHSVYRELFALPLPRTTSEQVSAGRRVSLQELRAGDLVFFRPTKRTNHVGIYLSNGRFAHISSSQGMMYSHLDEDYWRRAYWTSRRVLPEDVQQRTGPTPAHRTRPAAINQPSRGGW